MKEDILGVSELPTHTTSSEIFKTLNGFIEERSLEWKKCVGISTDGAARPTGRNSGLVTKIKNMAGNSLLSTHCYIHRQNLASRKMAPELNETLSQSVRIINYIKNSALNTRLLTALCDEMGSDQQNLFHSEFRWLSRGEVLKRSYELRKEVKLFLIHKKSDLSRYFQDNKWVARLPYHSDILPYINEFNLKLQGPDTTIFTAWNKTESFKKKLKLWLNMIAEGNNETFQSYSDYIMEADDFYSQNSVSGVIAADLKMLLLLSFGKYYPEIEDLRRQNTWVVNPFVEHKETDSPLFNYRQTKAWKVLLIL